MASLRPGEFVWTLEGKSQPYKISIADGATVTLSDATINGVDNQAYEWAGITCLGNQKKEYSTLHLANKNALQIMTVWGLFYTIWLDRALQRALSS